ncbi:FMN-binding protein [uncultured Clostridium sp.]|uniref:FMN-binding protein n=1 Tax=uncultured Clostridium sp. TaxID=59620 RepID=UPI00345D60B0
MTVNNNKIEDIELLNHKNERGKPAEIIVNEVIKEQKITVDTVSGATNSSKVILKAIENALEGK